VIELVSLISREIRIVKKNKIVLLTVLIMLVVYCGVVIFITKPETFAFSGILGDYNTITGTNKAQLMEEVSALIDEKIDNTVNDNVIPYVDSKASSIVSSLDDAVDAKVEAKLDAKVDAKVNEAFQELEAKLLEEKDSLVSNLMAQIGASSMVDDDAVANYVDSASYVDSLIPKIVPAVVSELEKNLDSYVPYVVKALIPELLTYEDALASDLYTSYRDSLIADITPDVVLGIMDNLEDEVFTFVGSVPSIPALADEVKVTVNIKGASDTVAPTVQDTASQVDVSAVVAELEKNLDSYAPYVANAVLPELEKDLEQYLPYIVDAVLKALEQSSSNVEVSSPEVATSDASFMSESEYDAIREEMRRTEISNILSQLN